MIVSLLRSKVIAANSLSLIIYTCLVIGKASTSIYNFLVSFYSANSLFILPKIRKYISKITFMLVFAIKKVFGKNRDLLSLLLT